MKLAKKCRRIYYCFFPLIILTAACGGGGGLSPGPADTELNENVLNDDLFGIWTFYTGALNHDCDPSTGINPRNIILEQEINVQPGAGCELSGVDEQGDFLHFKNDTVFNVGSAICRADNNTLVFEDNTDRPYPAGADCYLKIHSVGQFGLTGSMLEGPLVGFIEFVGSDCDPGWAPCSITTDVQGVPGRQIVGGTPYAAPPPPNNGGQGNQNPPLPVLPVAPNPTQRLAPIRGVIP